MGEGDGGLADLRGRIDAVDAELVSLLARRVALAGEIGALKAKEGAAFYDPVREACVLEKVLDLNGGALPETAVRAIYREIISASIATEKTLAIAYLGPEATYTHQAAIRKFGSSLAYRSMPTIPDVFAEVERGDADYGVIPIENSTEGAVFHSMDMLVESDLRICAQIYLPVEHCLLSASPMEAVREVHSKDQALGQCREWLRRHLPDARQVEVTSTAQAAENARERGGVAAVASALASELYAVPVLKTGIQDRPDNVTRFLVVGRTGARPVGAGGDKTSLVLSLRDESGALEKALRPFASRDINLTRIESRPSRKKAWDYFFFIDLVGHRDDPPVREAFAELEAHCPFVKWLGSYPGAG